MFGGLSDAELDNVVRQMLSDMGAEPDPEGAAEMGVLNVDEPLAAGNFRRLERSSGPVRMTGVDGGSAGILDAGSFMVAGVRVGHATYRGREFLGDGEPEMHLLHLAGGYLASAYGIVFRKYVGIEPSDAPRGLPEAVGRIRTLMEWHRVEELLDGDLPEGSVLAFDGALWAGIRGIENMLARITRRAVERGVVLCGVSKRSMLAYGSRPLIPAVQMMGQREMPGVAWYYPAAPADNMARLFGDVYVARLHPRSRYAFRIDLCLPSGISPDEAMGMLAYHADDPSYVGYPYPLVRVHNDVAFSAGEVADLREMLRERALASGMDPEEWGLLFQDFHGMLDTGR